MLSVSKINPLNVLKCREVNSPPCHFHYITFNLKYNLVQSIKEWIYENLKYRFYINETLVLDPITNQFEVRVKIGFEEAKEASFFLLACSHLKYCEK